MNRFLSFAACAMLLTIAGCSSESSGPATSKSNAAAKPYAEFAPAAGHDNGKKVVLIAGEIEYRSEETIPALAQILAKQGFHTIVLFTQDPKTGEIVPQQNYVPGLEALDDADLMVIFTRFLDLPSEQMQHIADYVDSGRPVIGIRTATHAFEIADPSSKFAKYGRKYEGADNPGGFGPQVLGVNWETHHGKNYEESTKGVIVEALKSHPILIGVEKIWGPTGAYGVHPSSDSEVLVEAEVLDGMTPDSPPDPDKNSQLMPLAWDRTYQGADGQTGRVFTTLLGASEDLANDGMRRMLVNACYWAVGLEDQITPTLDVSFVGDFKASEFGKDKHVKGKKPGDWDR